ncbi:ubiquinone biosynthesis accessory factor UbiJ [Chromohalobacter israelensis]|uniref:ubiquinone biosynthesis accessory factor UbiJ n=1 Tax=Chromohalobacter TaxID=42054 RepID=UPI0015C4211C|nr:SCP2 sterol-binding domain-containing protein [Chromohalobacter salexigens]MDO0946961.1 SCP2 sterol-binding domain-containing protein [Chromohalobacter salexigens]NWO57203.1 hypothetical protein [Chromohalobacter salexigens]
MPVMFSALLASAETLINGLLAHDPASPARLAQLAGQRLSLRLERPSLAVLVHFDTHGVTLLAQHEPEEADSDVVVELDVETLGALLGGERVESLLFAGRLSVRGRTHVLERASDLLSDLEIDWEGELARWLGDMPAHSLSQGLRRLNRFGLRTRDELRRDVHEYLIEEARLLPSRTQWDIAREHLTQLELATDRVEARLARLVREIERRRQEEHAS